MINTRFGAKQPNVQLKWRQQGLYTGLKGQEREYYPSCKRQTVFGLDLGKIKDFAALTCLDTIDADAPTNGEPWHNHKSSACVATKRWPLGTIYPTVVGDVKNITLRPQWESPVLVVDASGVGQPVVDWMRTLHMGCRVVPVTIVGGNSQRVDQYGNWHVAKAVLVSCVKIALQTGELIFAPGHEDLMNELMGYKCDVSGSGNEIYNAREGEHDDLVMSVCLANWYVMKGRRKIKVKAS